MCMSVCVCARAIVCDFAHPKISGIQSNIIIKKAPDFIPLCSKGPNKQLAKGSESCSSQGKRKNICLPCLLTELLKILKGW